MNLINNYEENYSMSHTKPENAVIDSLYKDFEILELSTQGSQSHKRSFLVSNKVDSYHHIKFNQAQLYAIVPLCPLCYTHMRLSQLTSGNGHVVHAWHCINGGCSNQVTL